MARPRRRIRFQPFRMGEKFRNTILVGLGVFLMAIFAVPFQGSCERQRGPGGRSPNDVMLTFDGTRVRYGEVWEMRRLCQQVLRLQLTDEGAAMRIASLLEAERAGLRVTDDEVLDEIHNRLFSRHLRVEHVIARSSAFAKDIPVSDKELDDAYAAGKDKRFRRADKSYQPLSEVRESLLAELRERQAGPKAKAALEALRKQVAAIAGAPLENALKQLARPPELEFGEAQIPDNRSAAGALRAIGDAPGIAERVYRQRIGELSEPLPVAGGWCVFRVVARTRGFGPDGDFYPEEEGWVRQGYGTINVKAYGEVLAELGVTRAEVESTIRQELTLVVPISLLVNSVGELPKPMVKARYVRDNTQAVPAYFALWAADFAHGVSYTEADLRDFYGRHKAAPRVGATPGYRQPERVSIEFVLGRTSAIEAKLPEAELERYYQRNSAFFGPSFKDSREAVRKRLADEKLQTAIKRASDRAADEAATGVHSDLLAVIGQEAAGFADAFQVRTTPTFASDEAERLVPELRGAKLAETLFGDRGRQYAVVGAEPKEGAPAGTRISEILACDAGRFFFRVAERQPSHEIPFEDLPAGLREQLIDDVKNDKALALAKAKAKEYRTRVYQAAFDRFAERLGVKPLETDLPKAGDPLPAVGQPVPALHAQLAGGEVGDLSDVIAAGANFVLGRLVAREEAKPNRIQIATFGKENLKLAWEPALYEVRAAYDAAPFEFLDKPKPVPFEKVKDDIAKLLARRQALKTASERTKAALAELAGVKQPDIAAAAAKHNLQLRKDVGVKLAQPEATPELGKAAGFRDAISALEPGEVSDVLASAEGRFILVMKSRDEKAGTATVDVAAALYEPLRKEAKIDDKEVKQYYDDNRDTAYVTDDEIKEATPWDGVSAAVRDRVRDKLKGEWAKKPLPDQLTALRDSLAIEAFRTVPTSTPLPTQRNVSLRVETIGPFPLSKPEEPLAKEPEALAAIKALKPGELTKPIATGRGALIALMADRRPGGLARAKVAAFSVADFLKDTPEPDAAAIERHFAANKPAFQLPATATVEFLFVDSAERQRTIRAGLTDDDCRRYFQERAENEYAGLTYEASEYRVRSDMARERATREARLAASDALEAVRKSQAPHAASFPAVAKKLKAAHGKSDPVELKEPMSLNVLGQVRGLADELNKLKPGELIPRVVESSQGYAVCRLAARTQSREPQLAEVRDRVAQALKVQTAREKMQGAAEKLRNAAAASSFDQAAAKALVKPNVVETELLDARAFALPGEGPAPALAEAVLALDKPGLTAVATEADGSRAFVALVTDRKPEELLTIEATTLESRRLAVPSPEEPPEEELKKFYEANKEEFRVPDQVQVEYLAAPAAELAKALPAPSEDEIRSEYQKSVDAGKAEYRDWALAPQLAFLPLEKARDRVRQNLLRARSLAEATKRVREALAALRAEGAKADFAAYAAKNPPLAAGKSDLFDREKKGLEPIGNAPDLAKQAFAAKKGDVAGPIEGADGACLIRLLEAKPSHVPPFDEIKLRVEMKWERKRDIARAVAAAARFHEKLAADFTKAPQKDRSEAFRKLVQADPVNIEVQQPLSVTLSRPIYPPDPRGRRSSLITGLGERPALLAVIFRQRPAHITPVVEDPERHACYVALLTQFIPPKDPTEFELFSTQYELTMAARTAAGASWQEYLNRQIERD